MLISIWREGLICIDFFNSGVNDIDLLPPVISSNLKELFQLNGDFPPSSIISNSFFQLSLQLDEESKIS